jgi:hypothetical protein
MMTTDRPALAKCAACGALFPLSDMLVCWDRRRPERTWHVCRPGLSGRCFAEAAGRRVDVGIALATDGVPGDAERLDLVR